MDTRPALELPCPTPVWAMAAGLPHAWQGQERWVVLDLDFGNAEHFAACWRLWRADPRRPARLFYVALLPAWLPCAAVQATLQSEGVEQAMQHTLAGQWPWAASGVYSLPLAEGHVRLSLAIGAPSETLPQRVPYADTILLSYGANSPIESEGLTRTASAMLAPTGQLVLLPAPSAGADPAHAAARRCTALQGAGLALERVPSPPATDPVWVGMRRFGPAPQVTTPPAPERRHALILGAGLAGSAVARALARRDWQIDQITAPDPRSQASTRQTVLAYHPSLTPDDAPLSRLLRQALWLTHRDYDPGVARWHGRIQLDTPERVQAAVAGMPPTWAQALSAAEASDRAGLPLRQGGIWFPWAGSVDPRALCQAWQPPTVRVHTAQIAHLTRQADTWAAYDLAGRCVAEAPVVIVASGASPWPLRLAANGRVQDLHACFAPDALRHQAGQSVLARLALPDRLPQCVLGATHAGHAIPWDAQHVLIGPVQPAPHAAATATQVQQALARWSDCLTQPPRWQTLQRSQPGVRLTTRDHLPVVGPSRGWPDLWLTMGFGGRGLLWSVLAAERLAAELNAEPRPVIKALGQALDPGRLQDPH